LIFQENIKQEGMNILGVHQDPGRIFGDFAFPWESHYDLGAVAEPPGAAIESPIATEHLESQPSNTFVLCIA